MVSMTVELRNIEDTQAAMGWAGGHTIIVDRAEGKAGGMGLGFNGGQLFQADKLPRRHPRSRLQRGQPFKAHTHFEKV